MLAQLSMAKIFALFVAGFALLRGMILFSETLWLSLLGFGLGIALVMIWASGWISQRLKLVPDPNLPELTALNSAESETEALSAETLEPEQPTQTPVVAMTGWGLLLLMLAIVLFFAPEDEPVLLEGYEQSTCDQFA